MARWTYLIYLPCAVEDSIATGAETGLFGKQTLRVEYTDGGEKTGLFVCMTTWGEKEPRLEIFDQYGQQGIQITQSTMDLSSLIIWENTDFSYEVEAAEEIYQEVPAEHHE